MQSGTELKIDVVALTDVGCQRTNNEDGFGYDLATRIFVVCDGMGGMAAGEVASATAVKELVDHFAAGHETGAVTEERLFRAIIHANQQVYQLAQSNEDLHGMGTTLVSACIDGRRLLIEKYDVHVVLSTKDLLQKWHRASALSAILIGNAKFDLSESDQRAIVAAFETRRESQTLATSLEKPTSSAKQAGDKETISATKEIAL